MDSDCVASTDVGAVDAVRSSGMSDAADESSDEEDRAIGRDGEVARSDVAINRVTRQLKSQRRATKHCWIGEAELGLDCRDAKS